MGDAPPVGILRVRSQGDVRTGHIGDQGKIPAVRKRQDDAPLCLKDALTYIASLDLFRGRREKNRYASRRRARLYPNIGGRNQQARILPSRRTALNLLGASRNRTASGDRRLEWTDLTKELRAYKRALYYDSGGKYGERGDNPPRGGRLGDVVLSYNPISLAALGIVRFRKWFLLVPYLRIVQPPMRQGSGNPPHKSSEFVLCGLPLITFL